MDTVPTMSSIVRGWLAFAAVGTGTIHLALVIGAPLPFAIVFALLGFVEFAWGVLAFAREPFAPRVAIAVAILPIVAWGALMTLAANGGLPELAASLDLLPLAIATVFELFIIAVLGRQLRRHTEATPRSTSTTKYLVGISAGALVVAGLTSPALAATDAGLGAPTHGGQTTVVDEPFELELPGHDAPGH
jgi:hypothetical protein